MAEGAIFLSNVVYPTRGGRGNGVWSNRWPQQMAIDPCRAEVKVIADSARKGRREPQGRAQKQSKYLRVALCGGRWPRSPVEEACGWMKKVSTSGRLAVSS